MVFIRSLFNSLPLLILMAGSCCSVCVEVPSDNLAVQGTNMKLACISCMKREEVSAETEVEWFYTSPEGENITMCSYYNGVQREVCPYKDRLIWNGSRDFQDVSVFLINITLNDTGRYTCRIRRYLNFEIHRHTTETEKYIDLLVTEEAGEDFTAVVSEIMMYVLLVFLTLWLLIEMVYCYIKISRADEVAQDSAESIGSLEQGKTPEPPEPIQGRCTTLHTL
ncbi:sodium channel subunit beta-3 isoform X1 [Acipenser ruthenus]|uniref:sodium channel subunit beta-3 isoform X1 n=2 Tax=Acipenser ruthenus TaxID=7906 RepID=UPI002741AAD5|nr:sodium channel subunit beta-3 isoform X1 [Acipenser ruthenus]XP_033851717.3 sodium channel subunit beta-3 isoform X1 [Acipenser ruthenus]XP_034768560.2 sodium channel subunit beta-3 isoform X1 [Acipenser ruthenus]